MEEDTISPIKDPTCYKAETAEQIYRLSLQFQDGYIIIPTKCFHLLRLGFLRPNIVYEGVIVATN